MEEQNQISVCSSCSPRLVDRQVLNNTWHKCEDLQVLVCRAYVAAPNGHRLLVTSGSLFPRLRRKKTQSRGLENSPRRVFRETVPLLRQNQCREGLGEGRSTSPLRNQTTQPSYHRGKRSTRLHTIIVFLNFITSVASVSIAACTVCPSSRAKSIFPIPIHRFPFRKRTRICNLHK